MEEEIQTQYINQFMEQFPQLTPEAKLFTRSFLIIEQYNKSEFLYHGGDIQREISYVCKGLIRKYYINEKGTKITTGFISENEYATDYPSFLRQQPSKYYIQCLEPSVIIKMSYKNLQEAYKKYRENEMYGRLAAENVLIRETDRVESLLFENAEERYLKFLEDPQ